MNALKSLLSDLKDAVLGAVANVLDREAVVVTGLAVSGVVAVAGSLGIVIPAATATAILAPIVGSVIARFFVYSKHTLRKEGKI
jgi:hypothetical protein